jgi:hypothetical protein
MSSVLCLKDKKSFELPKTTQLVTIKGFMDEPVRLGLKIIKKSSVLVVGGDGKTEIRLKTKYVYQYDEKLYERLKKAYDDGDIETLSKEWQCAKPIVIPERRRSALSN